MANYRSYGVAVSLFEAFQPHDGGRLFHDSLLYHTATEFALRNADGSTTYFFGTGLAWDPEDGRFVDGMIDEVQHYAYDSYIDGIDALDLAASAVQAAFEAGPSTPTLRATLLAGDDVLDARFRAGDADVNDTLHGGTGDDTIYGGSGRDRLWGGAGDDVLWGGDGDDWIVGGAGDDRIDGGTGRDVILAGDGDDLIYGGPDPDVIVYECAWTELVVTYDASTYSFLVTGPYGTDRIFTALRIATDDGTHVYDVATNTWSRESDKSGLEWLCPGRVLTGTSGADMLMASAIAKGALVIRGGGGDDAIQGGALALGGHGDDMIAGAARAYGGAGADAISGAGSAKGEGGDDTLSGTPGDDVLDGGNGGDRLHGGAGDDLLIGGRGADVFSFRWSQEASAPESWGHDVIADFQVGVDHIQLSFGSPPSPGDPTPSVSQTPEGVVIALDGADTILLKGLFSPGLTLDDLLI